MSNPFQCDVCGKEFGIDDIGYMGPSDRDSDECSPVMSFECICKKCEYKKTGENDG